MTADDEPLPEGFELFEARPELIEPLAHPTRMRIYREAIRGPVSAKELAVHFEVPLARMSYHVRALADIGLLRAVRHTPRRGAVETHYRAVASIDISDEPLRQIPKEHRRSFFALPVREFSDDYFAALEDDVMDEPDILLARAHFVATSKGRERLHMELLRIYERLGELERELAAEAAESEEELHATNVVLAHYSGERRAGRNGPYVVVWDVEGMERLDTIPNQ